MIIRRLNILFLFKSQISGTKQKNYRKKKIAVTVDDTWTNSKQVFLDSFPFVGPRDDVLHALFSNRVWFLLIGATSRSCQRSRRLLEV